MQTEDKSNLQEVNSLIWLYITCERDINYFFIFGVVRIKL